MTLKTSSFKINKTIFKKNTVRFWPIWVIYTIVMIFLLPVQLYTYIRSTLYYLSPDVPDMLGISKTQDLIQAIIFSTKPIVLAVFAIVAAVAVFSYLYGSRSCNMLHAFPVERRELFATNYVSGLLFLIVPQLISYVASLVICLIFSVPDIKYLTIHILMMLGISFFFYSFAVFCCMVTGNFFAAFGFFALFNFIYAAVTSLFVNLADQICYGFVSLGDLGGAAAIPGMALSPLVYLYEHVYIRYDHTLHTALEVTVSGKVAVLLYCVAAVVFIVLAMMLYSRRDLECAAEVSAHDFVRPLTRWMATITASMGLASWFSMVFYSDSPYFLWIWILSLVVISWAIFFVLEMLINKKFRVFKKKRFLEWAICAVLLVAATGLLESDVLGIEKRLPAVEDVKGVSVRAHSEMVLTEEEEISRMIRAHQTIIDQKTGYEMAYYDREQTKSFVSIEYFLKDGTSFLREYMVPDSEAYMADADSGAAQIRSLQEDTNCYLQNWIIANYESVVIKDGQLQIYGELGDQTIYLEKGQSEVLFLAIKQDINDNNIACYIGPEPHQYDEEGYYSNAYIELNGTTAEEPIELYDILEALRDEEDVRGIEYMVTIEDGYYGRYELTEDGYLIPIGFDIRPTCEHTIQALIDLQIIESADDILVKGEKY